MEGDRVGDERNGSSVESEGEDERNRVQLSLLRPNETVALDCRSGAKARAGAANENAKI